MTSKTGLNIYEVVTSQSIGAPEQKNLVVAPTAIDAIEMFKLSSATIPTGISLYIPDLAEHFEFVMPKNSWPGPDPADIYAKFICKHCGFKIPQQVAGHAIGGFSYFEDQAVKAKEFCQEHLLTCKKFIASIQGNRQ